jgi:1-deoxy-D-xylulose-5-phosphate synthase
MAYFRCLPNMIVSAPMNESELRNLMFTAQLPRNEKAFSIRYPRGQGVMSIWRTPMEEIKIGQGRKLREGEEIALLTIGHIGNYAVEVCNRLARKNIEIGHYDMRFVKPIDEEILHEVFTTYKKIITIEDGCIQGGFGSAVIEFMADYNYKAEIKRLGIPDAIIEHGEQIELHRECGFDPDGIEKSVIEMLESVSRSI